MKPVITVDTSGIDALLARVQRYEPSGMFDEIGHFIQFTILKRTSEGLDVEGVPFTPGGPGGKAYSISYEKVRQEKGLPIDHADLFFTGSMLGSMTYESSSRHARVFFMNTSDRKGMSNPAKAYYNNELREFFGLSAKDVRKIYKIAEDYIDGNLI